VSEQNKRFLRALPAGRISHFTSRIYPSLLLGVVIVGKNNESFTFYNKRRARLSSFGTYLLKLFKLFVFPPIDDCRLWKRIRNGEHHFLPCFKKKLKLVAEFVRMFCQVKNRYPFRWEITEFSSCVAAFWRLATAM